MSASQGDAGHLPGDCSAVGSDRELLATVIRGFLDNQITAFEFDDRLESFRGSQDPVIQYVSAAVWHYYDDCRDHLVCLNREEWNFLQRLLLLLSSDCVLAVQSQRLWSVRQLIAAACLAVFVYSAAQVGWGSHLLLLAGPFGVISMLLSRERRAASVSTELCQSAIHPFASLSDLRDVYRSTRFRKMRYPSSVSDCRIRSPLMDRFYQCYFRVVWLLLSPAALFMQTLPRTETRVHVSVANPGIAG